MEVHATTREVDDRRRVAPSTGPPPADRRVHLPAVAASGLPPQPDGPKAVSREAIRRKRRVRWISGWVVLLLALPLIWAFWPARYGGDTTLTVVSGASMEPTYRSGDLVIVRRGPFLEGDVVLYQIPDDQPGEGSLVIHRVQEILPSGQLLIQGDNKEHYDPWYVTSDDVLGTARYVVPGVGRVFTSAWVWMALALTIGVAVAWALWPSDDDDDEDASADGFDGAATTAGGTTVVAPGTGAWPDGPLGPDPTVADAPQETVRPHAPSR